MATSRWVWALIGLMGSLALSVVLWIVLGTPVLFLVVPFVPFLLGSRARWSDESIARCPACDFRTSDPDTEYCPRDGHRLIEE